MADISRNIERNGIEVSFPEKPEPGVVEYLKSRGYRWSPFARAWYRKFNPTAWEEINAYFNVQPEDIIPKDISIGLAPKPTEIKPRTSDFINDATTVAEVIEKLVSKHGTSPEKISHQIDLGLQIEKEHKDDPTERLRISFEHLWEDPEYYTKPKPKNWAEGEIKAEKQKAGIFFDLPKPETLAQLREYYNRAPDTFNQKRAIEDFVYNFAGDKNKKARQLLMQELIGSIKKPPVSKSGISAIKKALINWIEKENFKKAETKPIESADSVPETINIDGIERPTVNSEGKQIYPTIEGIKNFWKWFGDSKVVDEKGRPLVVYHGTKIKIGEKPFSVFKRGELGIHIGSKKQAKGKTIIFHWKDSKTGEILPDEEYGQMYELYANIKNPVYSFTDLKNWNDVGALKKEFDYIDNVEYFDSPDDFIEYWGNQGVDGVYYPNWYEGYGFSWIAFDPNQIKSATDNDGQFDPNSPDIRFSVTPGNNKEAETKQKPTSVDREFKKDYGKEFLRNTNDIGPGDNFKIYLVDGNKVRNDHIEFTMGGHGYVYDYVPKDEIWIDENLKSKPDDMEATIKHEVFEVHKMRDEGMDYETAHNLANDIEEIARHEAKKVPDLEGKQPYIAMYGDKTYELYADNLYAAKVEAIKHFSPSKKNEHMVHVHLAEEEETEKREESDVAKKRLDKLMLLRKFVSTFEYESLSDMMMGEEKEAGFEILDRVGAILETMPSTYDTENIPVEQKIVFLHYFKGGSDWYIVEKDKLPVQRQAFGYAILNGDEMNGEWGYISIMELIMANVELDFYWDPKPFGEVVEKEKEGGETGTDDGKVKEAIEKGYADNRNPKTVQMPPDVLALIDYLNATEDLERRRDIWNEGREAAGDGSPDIASRNRILPELGDTLWQVAIKTPYLTEVRTSGYEYGIRWNGEDLKKSIAKAYKEKNMQAVFDKPREAVPVVAIQNKKEISPEKPISLNIFDYPNGYEINKAIEGLLEKQWDKKTEDWTTEEKEFIKNYSGYGGLDKYVEKAGEKIDKKALFEFFTPDKVIEKMYGLAFKYGYDNGPLLEPSCGVGAFFDRRFIGNTVEKHGYEINKYSAKICGLLYPEAIINDGVGIKHFEELFIQKNYTVRNKVTPKYKLVIGNPPYGAVGGIYMGMGEKTYTHASNYIEYFIIRGLDLLEKDGLLVFIIGTAIGVPFLDQGPSKAKEMISERGKLIDAYRLPSGVFERTDVTSDIIVLRKR